MIRFFVRGAKTITRLKYRIALWLSLGIITPGAAFARVVDRLGLNERIEDSRRQVCFHTLRHTYASWLVEAGVDLYTVKELLGHKTLVMTARYSHLGENSLRQATRTLAATLDTVTPTIALKQR